MKAEEARGRLDVHKHKGPDFNSSERIGQFNQFSFGGRSLHGAGMDHAASTAKHTADTFRVVESMLQMMKGYIGDPNNNRAKHTAEAFRGVHF